MVKNLSTKKVYMDVVKTVESMRKILCGYRHLIPNGPLGHIYTIETTSEILMIWGHWEENGKIDDRYGPSWFGVKKSDVDWEDLE